MINLELSEYGRKEQEKWRHGWIEYYQRLYDQFQDGSRVNPPPNAYLSRVEEPLDLQSKDKSPGEILFSYRKTLSEVSIVGLEPVIDDETGKIKEGLFWPLIQYPQPWQE